MIFDIHEIGEILNIAPRYVHQLARSVGVRPRQKTHVLWGRYTLDELNRMHNKRSVALRGEKMDKESPIPLEWLYDHDPVCRAAISGTATVVSRRAALAFGTTMNDVFSRKRHREAADARHAAMYVLRIQAGWHYSLIGRLFDRDHSSVVYAVQKVRQMCETDDVFSRHIDSLLVTP